MLCFSLFHTQTIPLNILTDKKVWIPFVKEDTGRCLKVTWNIAKHPSDSSVSNYYMIVLNLSVSLFYLRRNIRILEYCALFSDYASKKILT